MEISSRQLREYDPLSNDFFLDDLACTCVGESGLETGHGEFSQYGTWLCKCFTFGLVWSAIKMYVH